MMTDETIETVKQFLLTHDIKILDITGGAPELHPRFFELVEYARAKQITVIDRCNLTILLEPSMENLASFLAEKQVDIVASLPCYQADNVDNQRGSGVFEKSIEALQRLNRLGYGKSESGLNLNLVYNPQGPVLPPNQEQLEQAYKTELQQRYGIEFNQLYTLCNMPIQRFGSTLISNNTFDEYMLLLKNSHNDSNLGNVMCKSLLSVDWQGYVYDCDFNQMLGLNLKGENVPVHLTQLLNEDIQSMPINVRDHCYGCTAGQGSSCGGALA